MLFWPKACLHHFKRMTCSLVHSFTARPDIQMLVNAETINGTHYQSVSCSAVGGRPASQISWLFNGDSPPDYPFNVVTKETLHSNGTSTLNSILHFPTHHLDEDSVTCVVKHPTLSHPKLTTVMVETYGMDTATAECCCVLTSVFSEVTYITVCTAS